MTIACEPGNGRGILFIADLEHCSCEPDLRFMQYIYSYTNQIAYIA